MATGTIGSLGTFQYALNSGWTSPRPLLDSDQSLVVVFGSPEFKNRTDVWNELRNAFPSSHIVGCSTAGEILGSRVFDATLSVVVKKFEHTSLSTASVPVRGTGDSFNSGAAIAHQLMRPGLRGVLVLSDGLNVNGTELVRGLTSVLPKEVTVSGGLAGDGSRFKETWVLHNGVPESGLVSAVGFYGDRVQLGYGCKGGWSPFGPERTITKSRGNTLFELDGTPALELYKKYLGERAAELPASGLLFPLAIRSTRGDATAVVRTILGVSEAEHSLTFAGDIPQGWTAQLMRANFDWLVDASAESARDACENRRFNSESLTIAVSCVGRRLILGERTEDELAAAKSSLPSDGQLIGFYSYGELSPHATSLNCELHNQTMTITSIGEI